MIMYFMVMGIMNTNDKDMCDPYGLPANRVPLLVLLLKFIATLTLNLLFHASI